MDTTTTPPIGSSDGFRDRHEPGWDDYLLAFATLPLFIVAAFIGFIVCAIVDGFLKGWHDYKGVADHPLGHP